MARKKANIHYLYKTTCLITNRYYIGMHSTSNLEDGYLGSGLRLRRSIRKYGVDNHKKEILEFFASRELLIEREKEIITFELIKDDLCMNLVAGGNGGFISKEGCSKGGKIAREKILERLRTDDNFREEYKRRASKIMTNNLNTGKIKRCNWNGKKHKEETKKLMSEKAKQRVGEANSQYGTCWITREGINKKIKKEDLENYLKEGWIRGRN